jgi:undecaprenyl-diphosphatase
MAWWQAVILGIVEGVTEYLPVSSTGHLVLTAWLLGLADDPAQWKAAFTFNIVIQAGAIAAVLLIYWSRVKQMLLGVVGRDRAGRTLAINIVVAFLPAAVLGPLLNDRIEQYLNGPWPVVGALFVGGWLMLAVAYSRKLSRTEHRGRDLDSITWKIALLIGFGQCIAMWPGTSRSMMTIVAGLMLGLRPRAAAEFTFLLGLVTLSAATAYKGFFDGRQMLAEIGGWMPLVLGFITATISAALAVKWFVAFLTRHGLAPFAWYRLGIASVLAGLLVAGVLTLPLDGEREGEAPAEPAAISRDIATQVMVQEADLR